MKKLQFAMIDILVTTKSYFPYYIFIFSIVLIVIAVLEFFLPHLFFKILNRYVNFKLFRIHGLLYVLGYYPLTQFKHGIYGNIMFFIGVFYFFSGPVILFYPDIFKKILDSNNELFKNNDKPLVIYFDSSFKIISSIIFILAIKKYLIV